MGENGRRLAVDRHGMSRHVAEMTAAYREAVAVWEREGSGG